MQIRLTDAAPLAAPLAIVVLAALTSACASTGAVPRPFPMPGGSPGSAQSIPSTPSIREEPPNPANLDSVVETAMSLRGVPYRNGGVDPSGFDCSGFTQYVFSQHGVGLPRAVRDQFELGASVKAEAIAAGDLLFFSTTARGASHVGIAIDRDEFVHAPSRTGVVRIEHISSAYWSRRFLGARRLVNEEQRSGALSAPR